MSCGLELCPLSGLVNPTRSGYKDALTKLRDVNMEIAMFSHSKIVLTLLLTCFELNGG